MTGASTSFIIDATMTDQATGGTVTSVSVATANGVSGTVANPTTAPVISLTLGAITPSSVVATGAISGATLQGAPIVVSVTGASKTFGLTDANTIQDCSNSSAQTLTIPTNASVAFPVNTVIQIEQNGTGIVTITGAATVTVNGVSVGSVSLQGQFTAIYLRQESANVWYAEGISNTAQSTLNGTTAGTIKYSMPFTATNNKQFTAFASGYENNTAVNQTIAFPVAFTNTPVVVANNTGLTISVSTTTLTITAPNSVTTFSGTIIVGGY